MKIEPCPFCSSDDTFTDHDYDEGYYDWWCGCKDCGAIGPWDLCLADDSKDRAIEDWNTRKGDATQDECVFCGSDRMVDGSTLSLFMAGKTYRKCADCNAHGPIKETQAC